MRLLRKILLFSGALIVPVFTFVNLKQEEILSYEINVDSGLLSDGPVASIEYGNYFCGIEVLSTVHARTPANTNDLQVWCRPKEEPLIQKMNFERIPRDVASSWNKTFVANHFGELFEYRSKKVWKNRDWVQPELVGLPNDLIWYQEKQGGGFYAVTAYRQGCNGYHIQSDQGYHGTFTGNYAATYFWRDELIVILDRAVKSFKVGPTKASCIYIEPRMLSPERTWGYGMFPYKEKLAIGGTEKTPATGNSQLMLYDGKRIEKMDLVAPGLPGQPNVTEYYSYLTDGKNLLVGTYPSGKIAKLNNSFQLSLEPPLVNNFEVLESEAQSMTTLAGSLVVGMYPFGEIWEKTPAGTWYSTEIVPGLRDSGDMIPFDKAYRKKFEISDNEFSNGSSKIDRKAISAYQDNQLNTGFEGIARIARMNGIARSSWGFRITSLAIFDGKLCLGTGNMQGVIYNENVHTWIPPEIGNLYGDIFCSNISNQALISDLRSGKYQISISRKRILIRKDGKVLMRRKISGIPKI